MKQMEADLGTKLDWIAVDHHNTGHPHTHILVRGITDDGKTLNIAGDYIAYGIRERASEIVTRELGRQTELEVTKQLEREVDADRFTRLDRMLIAEQQGKEFSDLRPDQDMRDTFRQNRALLIERARKLERMGLATEIETGQWIVSPKAEPTLRELGERGDIIKTMHRALEREGLAEDRHPARYVLHRENATERIVGRVLDKGLGGDEMGERVRLVIDGVDGRVHHIEMDAARAEDVGRGMIVAAGSAPPGPRAADRNIMDVAGQGGVYRPSEHLERARAAIDRIGGDPEAFVRSHVRRLEALRRAGHAERIDADHWRVGLACRLVPTTGLAGMSSPSRIAQLDTGREGRSGACGCDRPPVRRHLGEPCRPTLREAKMRVANQKPIPRRVQRPDVSRRPTSAPIPIRDDFRLLIGLDVMVQRCGRAMVHNDDFDVGVRSRLADGSQRQDGLWRVVVTGEDD